MGEQVIYYMLCRLHILSVFSGQSIKRQCDKTCLVRFVYLRLFAAGTGQPVCTTTCYGIAASTTCALCVTATTLDYRGLVLIAAGVEIDSVCLLTYYNELCVDTNICCVMCLQESWIKCCLNVTCQQELGKLLDDIGAVSSALEVYLRLQSWENVITCYAKLGHQQKVRPVIVCMNF